MLSSVPEIRHYARKLCQEWRRRGTHELIPDGVVISGGKALCRKTFQE
jgi:hypothetical protein